MLYSVVAWEYAQLCAQCYTELQPFQKALVLVVLQDTGAQIRTELHREKTTKFFI